MNKAILAILALLASFLPLATVAGDSDTPGDDLIETVFYGTVTDNETGFPIEGAWVHGFGPGYSNYQLSITEETGEYYLEFHNGGDYTLYVTYEDYTSVVNYEIIQTNERKEVDFIMDPIHYQSRVYGMVTDESNEPLEGVQVTLYIVIYNDDGSFHLSPFCNMDTGNDGIYSLDADPGNYTIGFDKNYYTSVNGDTLNDPFQLFAGDEKRIDMRMEKWSQGVTGEVTDEYGQPIYSVLVQISNDEYLGNYWTNEDGQYYALVPEPGYYTLAVYVDGHRPYSKDVTIYEGEMQEVDIQLEKAYLPDPIVRLIYRILELLGII